MATLLSLVVKEQKPAFSFLLIVFTGVTIFIFLVDYLFQLIRMIENIAKQASIDFVYIETILKIVGIAYIAEFGAQVAKDAGHGSIASKIELAGKILILSMAIPIITVIIQTMIKLLPDI